MILNVKISMFLVDTVQLCRGNSQAVCIWTPVNGIYVKPTVLVTRCTHLVYNKNVFI